MKIRKGRVKGMKDGDQERIVIGRAYGNQKEREKD
jgi:hypothetical protein